MPPLHPILAFEFVNLPMLGWLGAAAAPVLIHLWARRRYRTMVWAAMEYLLAALRRTRRWMTLEQLLLLLVRTLIVVLLVLAVAEPRLVTGPFASAPGQRTHRLIVLDGSYSMAYKPVGASRFEEARQTAAQIVRESSEGDGFTLVLMGDPPRIVVGTPAFESTSFLRELDALDQPHTTADVAKTLAAVEQVLQSARREAPRLTREEVYFLTDLGRVGWSLDRLDAAARADFHQRALRLAETAALVVLDLGQAGADNTAITALGSSEPFATPGQTFEVHAELKQFGSAGRQQVPVELLVDGRRTERRSVDLEPGGSASVALPCRFDSPGDHVVEVRTEGDRLEVDNHRWLSVPVKPALRVLCIDGRMSGDPQRGAGAYLAAALAPRGDEGGRALVRPEVRPESALMEVDLAPYDCVFLANVAQFTADEARILDGYLRQGGSLVFLLGDQVLAERYNQELGGEGSGRARLLPCRLGPILGPQERLDPLGYRHPIVRVFQGYQRAGLVTTYVQKYFKLTVPENSKADVVLAMANGDPFLVEEPIHRGRVFLLATAADTSWTWLPVWPSFVPIVQEILAYAVAGQIRQRNVLVGEPLGETFAVPVGEMAFTLRKPGGRTEDARVRADGPSSAWSYAETVESGVYTAEFGAPVLRTEAFAVNVDPAESDLATITPEELRDEVWPGVSFTLQTTWQHAGSGEPAGAVSRPSELAKTLLYAVLVLLVVETYLARRFGHHAP